MSLSYGAIEAESWVQSEWIENCCNVASACLVFYDHFATLGREIDLMWNRRLSSVTLLFHFNRWATLIWVIVTLLESNLSNLEYESSLMQSLPVNVRLGIFGYVLEVALFGFWAGIRMYAVSSGSWPLAFITSLLSMVTVGTNVYAYFGATTYIMGSIPDIGQWCIMSINITEDGYTKCGLITLSCIIQTFTARCVVTIATRLCAIAADVLILVVTWHKTYATKREADRHGIKTPLAAMLLRDGTLYFILLLCLNVLNMAGIATNVFSIASIFSTPLSSIIISHFLLNLRQLAYGPHDDELDSQPSFVALQNGSQNGSRPGSLRFASFVDNMGEDLDHGTGAADRNMDWDAAKGDADIEAMSGSDPDAAEVGIDVVATGVITGARANFGDRPPAPHPVRRKNLWRYGNSLFRLSYGGGYRSYLLPALLHSPVLLLPYARTRFGWNSSGDRRHDSQLETQAIRSSVPVPGPPALPPPLSLRRSLLQRAVGRPPAQASQRMRRTSGIATCASRGGATISPQMRCVTRIGVIGAHRHPARTTHVLVLFASGVLPSSPTRELSCASRSSRMWSKGGVDGYTILKQGRFGNTRIPRRALNGMLGNALPLSSAVSKRIPSSCNTRSGTTFTTDLLGPSGSSRQQLVLSLSPAFYVSFTYEGGAVRGLITLGVGSSKVTDDPFDVPSNGVLSNALPPSSAVAKRIPSSCSTRSGTAFTVNLPGSSDSPFLWLALKLPTSSAVLFLLSVGRHPEDLFRGSATAWYAVHTAMTEHAIPGRMSTNDGLSSCTAPSSTSFRANRAGTAAYRFTPSALEAIALTNTEPVTKEAQTQLQGHEASRTREVELG
ncbi:hypothetical protein OBBRIDRAFT_836984 [Obba rivulosa]|uniref:DUF6533 domain-containing protein n=1 Tax=Obba rivulosa TaxID=1052685 RepID=A0A8E2ANF6_9APHY|nr:hypothetical protein OBBRIDRAFT_836984 [Obba rivulosa]